MIAAGLRVAGLSLLLGWFCAPAIAADTMRQMNVEGVALRIELSGDDFRGGADPLLKWIQRSLHIVTGYYSGFPTSSLRIKVVPESGDGVRGGKTWGYDGGFIRIQVGHDVTERQLENDWVLVHEMTHLALPDLGDAQSWFSEGLAVYIEGIAREQAGNRTEQDIFVEQMRQMPRGLPQAGDSGLDHTHTWARTYWGGAMFCFLADVEIHRRTNNRMGLQDAMGAVARASGGLRADWPIQRVFTTADAATGTQVLEELYMQMKDKPVSPDLHELWTKLGVMVDGDSVKFNDEAPLAAVRRSIMAPRASKA
jgi:hypothetical protein